MKARDVQVGMRGFAYGREIVVLAIGLAPPGYQRGGSDGVRVRRVDDGRVLMVRARQITPLEPIAEPEVDPNAGTCSICCKIMKVDPEERLVLHGYTRPGDGWIRGSCPGTKTEPYEKSPQALHDFRPSLVRYRQGQMDWLGRLERDEPNAYESSWSLRSITSIYGKSTGVPFSALRGHPDFPHLRKRAIDAAQLQIRMVDMEIERVDTWIRDWTLKPLRTKVDGRVLPERRPDAPAKKRGRAR